MNKEILGGHEMAETMSKVLVCEHEDMSSIYRKMPEQQIDRDI